MADLPNPDELVGNSVTEKQFKEKMTQMIEAIESNSLFKQKTLEVDASAYRTSGYYYVASSSSAASIANLPEPRAGVMHVTQNNFTSSTGEQIFYSYSGKIWSRTWIVQNNVVTFSLWISTMSEQEVDTKILNKLNFSNSTSATNANTVIDDVALQVARLHATAANNFPTDGTSGSSGVLLVRRIVDSLCNQTYFCSNGLFNRYATYSNSAWTWAAWIKYPNVSAVNDLIVSKLSELQVLQQFAATGHLDSLIARGTYTQSSSTGASVANGYPFQRAGNLIVATHSNGYISQTYITIDGIAVRQFVTGFGWSAWSKFLNETNLNTLINSKISALTKNLFALSSSTLTRILDQGLAATLLTKGFNVTRHTRGGDNISGSMLGQGSQSISLMFATGSILYNADQQVSVTLSQTETGESTLTQDLVLENGVKGVLTRVSVNNFTFRTSNITSNLAVDSAQGIKAYKITAGIKNNSVFMFNVGKNDVTVSTAEILFSSTKKVVDYTDFDNRKLIILGHYSNTTYVEQNVQKIENLNALLKKQYGLHYVDINDFLFDDATWNRLGLTKTTADEEAISKRVLPPSLSFDEGHMSNAVNAIVSENIINKMISLGYTT